MMGWPLLYSPNTSLVCSKLVKQKRKADDILFILHVFVESLCRECRKSLLPTYVKTNVQSYPFSRCHNTGFSGKCKQRFILAVGWKGKKAQNKA